MPYSFLFVAIPKKYFVQVRMSSLYETRDAHAHQVFIRAQSKYIFFMYINLSVAEAPTTAKILVFCKHKVLDAQELLKDVVRRDNRLRQ
jgi:hypothetical protein